MARKSYHGKVGVKFKAPFTASKKKSMMRNLTSELIKFGRVEVTEAVSKDLISVADRMVTYAKKGDLHHRRLAASYVRDIDVTENQTVLSKLFDEIGPKFATRNGGYTRAIKLVNRRGDNSPMCIVEFVD